MCVDRIRVYRPLALLRRSYTAERPARELAPVHEASRPLGNPLLGVRALLSHEIEGSERAPRWTNGVWTTVVHSLGASRPPRCCRASRRRGFLRLSGTTFRGPSGPEA